MVNSQELLLVLYPVAPVEPSTRARDEGSLMVERQNALHVSAGVNVLEFPERLHPKAAEVSPWYGFYSLRGSS